MNKICKFLLVQVFSLFIFSSCSTVTAVSFLCHDRDIQIYVNDTYLGKELVTYTAPKGVTTADIECKKDGITIFTKSIYIKGYNGRLFELTIPESYTYSSERHINSK